MVLIIYQKNTAYAGDDAKSVPVQKTHLSIISFDSGHDSDTQQKTMAIVGNILNTVKLPYCVAGVRPLKIT